MDSQFLAFKVFENDNIWYIWWYFNPRTQEVEKLSFNKFETSLVQYTEFHNSQGYIEGFYLKTQTNKDYYNI